MAVFLEDLHWADDSALNLLEHLQEFLPAAQLLLVGLTRPNLFERRAHWVGDLPLQDFAPWARPWPSTQRWQVLSSVG